MAFVADSAAALGARWAAAWRFKTQIAAFRDREANRDHAGWITYYEGAKAERLRRLRPPAIGEAKGDGVVVASTPSLIGESGRSLVRAGRRVERDLFGYRSPSQPTERSGS